MLRLPLKHYTFRLALMYLALFSASFLLLFGFLVWNTDHSLQQQLRTELVNDALHFIERDQISGEEGIIRLIGNRIQTQRHQSPALYLYRDPQQAILAGTLDRWPFSGASVISSGIRVRSLQHQNRHYLTLSQRLPSGGEILLGKSTAMIKAARNRLVRIFSVGSLLTLLLGALSGWWLSRRAVARIEAINALCEQIIDGDLSQRLNLHAYAPQTSGDDLDQLSLNINRMLDRIETLMHEVSTVSNHIAHDLRTPLSRLRNQLEQLETASSAPAREKSQIRHAISEADQLLSTFNALLRIAKIESGQRQAAFELVSLRQIAKDVVEMYAPIAEDAGLQLQLARATPVPSFTGDRNLLFQALANLVDNAIKHSQTAHENASSGNTIQITLEHNEKAKTLKLNVCDQGEGIPANALEEVLKRFYRLDASRSTPGNGLGLSLVKAITHLHHGELVLSANTPQGLCAQITLPASKSATARSKTPPQATEYG